MNVYVFTVPRARKLVHSAGHSLGSFVGVFVEQELKKQVGQF